MKDLRVFLQKRRPVITNGATGTELMRRGGIVPGGISNLECPDLVLEIQREYMAVGVDLLLTNTFSMNPIYAASHAPGYDVAGNQSPRRCAGKGSGGGEGLYHGEYRPHR